jgi:hypothetical protein
MLKSLLALGLLGATPAGAAAQWALADGSEGCMVHSSTTSGTVLSITATPGEDALLFVIQNRQFATLEDGQQYAIDVEFDDLGEWQIEALAQAELDRDGPGVIFAVRPGRTDGKNFISEFAGASGMRIGREGARLDTVSLAGGNGAMSSLARCLGQQWSGARSYEGRGGPIEGEEIEAGAVAEI